MARIGDQKRREFREERELQRRIGADGLPPVEQTEVDAAFVGIAHAIEKAELTFQMLGDAREVLADQQTQALRRLQLEEARCRYYVQRQDAAEDARRREFDEERTRAAEQLAETNTKLARVQAWLAGAIVLATFAQLGFAVWQALGGGK